MPCCACPWLPVLLHLACRGPVAEADLWSFLMCYGQHGLSRSRRGFSRRCPVQIQEGFAVSSLMSKGEQQDPGMKVSLWQPWPHHLLHLIGGKMALLRATAPLLSSGSREKQTDGHQQIIINDFLRDGRWFTQCILSPSRKELSELFLVCCTKLRIGENE